MLSIFGYTVCVGLDPSSAEYHRSLASIFKNTGATENAVQFYEQARLRDPQDARTQSLLAEALKDLGDFNRALEHYREGLRLNPDDTETRLHIDKLELVIDLSRAMLQKRDPTESVVCDLGDERFGHQVFL